MGNGIDTPIFFSMNFLLCLFFINTHKYAKTKICISAKNKKTYAWALIWYQGRYTMISCCLDTNHFVGTLESYCGFSHYGGRGVNFSRQDSLSQFLLCY